MVALSSPEPDHRPRSPQRRAQRHLALPRDAARATSCRRLLAHAMRSSSTHSAAE